MSKPTLKALTARVEALERILEDFASRHFLAADTLKDNVKMRIHGIREIRGNDGVLLGTIRTRDVAPTRRKSR